MFMQVAYGKSDWAYIWYTRNTDVPCTYIHQGHLSYPSWEWLIPTMDHHHPSSIWRPINYECPLQYPGALLVSNRWARPPPGSGPCVWPLSPLCNLPQALKAYWVLGGAVCRHGGNGSWHAVWPSSDGQRFEVQGAVSVRGLYCEVTPCS